MSDQEGLTEHNFLIDATRERLAVGSPLFEEGEHGEELFVVVKGRVLLSRRTQAGENVAVATIQAGGVLGEIALLQPGPRSASAIIDRSIHGGAGTLRYLYGGSGTVPVEASSDDSVRFARLDLAPHQFVILE